MNVISNSACSYKSFPSNYEVFSPRRSGLPERAQQPPNYNTLKTRLISFKDWPKQLNQKPKDLAQSGFYYLGESDKVICFSCGIGLNDWEAEDDPWFEHKKWSPDCTFLNRGGNRDFLEKYGKSENFEAKEIPESLNCIVCSEKMRCILSLPCRHLSTCEECNEKLDKCPVCNKEENHRVKIYIP